MYKSFLHFSIGSGKVSDILHIQNMQIPKRVRCSIEVRHIEYCLSGFAAIFMCTFCFWKSSNSMEIFCWPLHKSVKSAQSVEIFMNNEKSMHGRKKTDREHLIERKKKCWITRLLRLPPFSQYTRNKHTKSKGVRSLTVRLSSSLLRFEVVKTNHHQLKPLTRFFFSLLSIHAEILRLIYFLTLRLVPVF